MQKCLQTLADIKMATSPSGSFAINKSMDSWILVGFFVVTLAFVAQIVQTFELTDEEVSEISRQKYKFRKFDQKEGCERFIEHTYALLGKNRCTDLRSSYERLKFVQQLRDAQEARVGSNSLTVYLDSCARLMAAGLPESDTALVDPTTTIKPEVGVGAQQQSNDLLAECEAKLAASESSLAQVTSENERLRGERSQAEVRLQEELEQTVQRYESKLAAMEAHSRALRSETGQMRVQAAELKNELFHKEKRLQEVLKDKSELDRLYAIANATAIEQLTSLEVQLEAVRRDEELARARADQLAEKVQELERMHKTCSDERSSLRETCKADGMRKEPHNSLKYNCKRKVWSREHQMWHWVDC